MPSIADVYVTILPETSRVGPGIKRALRALDDDFYRAGKRWGDEIDRGLGDKRNLLINANTAAAEKKIRELERKLDALERGGPGGVGGKRTVKLDVDTDRSAFTGIATALRNVQTNATAAAIGLASLPNTIANVATSAVQLSGALGLMPAGIGAAALAFGSLKVATLGFGDAMKNIRDPEKFAESLGNIAPNMQELAKAIQTALPEIDRLKFTVQDAFGAGLGEQFTKLSTTYLPMFQTVMSQMAASANTALTTVSQMMQQPAMIGDMSAMTGNMSSAFNILSQALAPVVKAFVDIGVVGSGFLPKLAAAATQAANQFAIFIDKARATGDLDKWIQGGIDALATLGRIAGDIFNIFMKFAGMDTVGGGLLGMIEGITSTVSEFVNSPAGSGAIQTFITTLGTATQALLPLLGALLQALSPILAGLGGLAAVVVQALAPALTTWVTAMQPVIETLMAGLTPVLAALQPVLTEVAQQLVQHMLTGIQQILPLLGPLVDQFAQLLIALLPLIPQVVQLATMALPQFIQALEVVLPLLTTLTAIWTNQANTVIPLVGAQMSGMAEIFTSTWGRISDAVTTAVNIITPILENLKAIIESVVGPLERLLGMVSPLAGAVSWVAGRAGESGGGVFGPGGPGSQTVSATPWGGGTPPPGGTTVPRGTPGAIPRPGTNEYMMPPTPGSIPSSALDRTRFLPESGPGSNAPPLPAPYTPPVSNYVAPVLPSSSGGGGGGGGGVSSDRELLSRVPAGQYAQIQAADLTKGLGDCSSAVEDLVAIMEGRPTGGRSLSTHNAAEWLTAHGFVPGTMPGAFNVGYNAGHMQATLPGGTNFNWGSAEAAARGGVGGTGAFDPAFTSHYYRPVPGVDPTTAAPAPSTTAYPAETHLTPTSAATPTPQLRDKQQKVDDKARAIEYAQARLDALLADPNADPLRLAKAEDALAKANREHADALDDLAAAQDKYNQKVSESPEAKSGAGGMGESFGQNFMAGIAEFFGFDGTLFKNPAEFGLIKFLGGLSKLKPSASQDPTMPGSGGGGGIMDTIAGLVPEPFGPLQQGSPGNAPGQFMPLMPSAADASISPFQTTGQPGVAGPGNQPIDNRIVINNPVGQDHLTGMMDEARSAQYPRVRQPMRALPVGGP